MDQKSNNTFFNLERKLVRRKFLLGVGAVTGAAALGITAGGITLKTTHAAPSAVPFHRSYHKSGIDHFYTISDDEWNNAARNGWQKEIKAACYVLAKQVEGSVPLYRSYHKAGIDHFYTISKDEWDNAAKHGWQKEGIACYVFAKQVKGSVPLYRSYNSAGVDHFYTTSKDEWNNAAKHGWKQEGIACYVFTHS